MSAAVYLRITGLRTLAVRSRRLTFDQGDVHAIGRHFLSRSLRAFAGDGDWNLVFVNRHRASCFGPLAILKAASPNPINPRTVSPQMLSNCASLSLIRIPPACEFVPAVLDTH